MKTFVELCSAEEGACPHLGVCGNVYPSSSRCDPGALEPKTPNTTTDLKISSAFVLGVFKGKLQISHCDSVARSARSVECISYAPYYVSS